MTSPDNLTFRLMTDDDWAAVWDIIRPVLRAGETYPLAPDTSEEAARAAWSTPPTKPFVAIAGGVIAATYYIRPNQPTLGDHVCNCGYMVAENFQNRGIGAAACADSQQQAIKLGYRAMQYNLVVATNQAAIRTWTKNGFTTVGVLPKAFRHLQLGFVDAYIMVKELTPE